MKRLKIVLLLLLIGLGSLCLGWGMAQVIAAPNPPHPLLSQTHHPASMGTVDPVPQRYQLGLEIYLENCATCHIGLPPEVLPTETWRQLLQDSQHYGQQLQPLVDPSRLLVWNYLQAFSRPLAQNEAVPYQVANSRYFKALHPRVELPRPLSVSSCVTCHPSAEQFNFRQLAPEWKDAD